MVILAPIVAAPDTEILETPVTDALNVAAPVMLYAPIPDIAPVLAVFAAVLLTSPKVKLPPTIPAKLTAPDPAFRVSALAWVKLFNVELNVRLLFVVVNVVDAPSVTAFPNIWLFVVTIDPPLIAVVPVAEFCIKLALATEALNVVIPVLVKEILPRPLDPPTAPVKVILDVPTLILSARAVASALFTVLANVIVLFVVASVLSAERITALL